MFNIGGPEVLVIALIALVVVGPEQLPSVLRKAGQYAAQIRQMSTGLRQEFMAGVDELDPTNWEGERGTGEPDKPIVPKGYADRVAAGDKDNPFKAKPVSQQMADASPDEAAAEAVAAAEKAEAEARQAMEKARKARTEARDAKAAAEAAAQEAPAEVSPADTATSDEHRALDALADSAEADSTVSGQDSESAE
jgi:sec-independent protein translocase protein TatB